MFNIIFIPSLELKWECNIQSNLLQPLVHEGSTSEEQYSTKLCRSYAPLSFTILHQSSACHLKVLIRISLTSFTCCWHNLMCRYANLQQKNSNMQQKNIPFPSYSWVFCPFFNILCVLVFMVVLDMSYCLSDVGMWASSLSWQFESRGRSSHSFLMSTGSLISTL